MKNLYAGAAFCLTLSTTFALAKEASPVEQRLEALEKRLGQVEQQALAQQSTATKAWVLTPNLEVILSGRYGLFSQEEANIPGFQTASPGMRYPRGFSLEESALRLSAQVDNQLSGVLTLLLANNNGKDELSLEEAFLQTLRLPWGASLKAGRMLPLFGYMNEVHKHDDDFVDRPLPYRAYLSDGFSDDGIEASLRLPTGFSSKLGGGAFRGRGFPANAQGHKPGLFTAYVRIGNPAGEVHCWRLGGYALYAQSRLGREAEGLVFNGNNQLYAMDFQYHYAPAGNPNALSLQAEYMFRREKGRFHHGPLSAAVDTKTSGFYAQATYAFMKHYRLGYRYTLLGAPLTPAGFENTSLGTVGRNLWMHSLMAEFNTSAFGRFRLQYNHSKTHSRPEHQLMVHYLITFGAQHQH